MALISSSFLRKLMLTDWVGRLVGSACWNVLIAAPPKRKTGDWGRMKRFQVLQMSHGQLLYFIYVFITSSHRNIRKFRGVERDIWVDNVAGFWRLPVTEAKGCPSSLGSFFKLLHFCQLNINVGQMSLWELHLDWCSGLHCVFNFLKIY